jgi:hypothetical protein
MKPDAPRSGRSRARRFAVNVLILPLLWAVIAFICINSFEAYTEVGDLGLLTLILLFALWSWWYAEDRDRRRALKQTAPDRDGHSANGDGDGHPPAMVDRDGHSPSAA